jgi:hypothetical protein
MSSNLRNFWSALVEESIQREIKVNRLTNGCITLELNICRNLLLMQK